MTLLRVALLQAICLSLVGNAQHFPGAGVKILPKDRICFALYTVSDQTLKLTAQFYPLEEFDPFVAELQVLRDNEWITIAGADIQYPGYIATFRVDGWDDQSETRYRVAHNKTAYYEGTIRKNPVDQDTFTLASLSCNSVRPQHGGELAKQDIVENLRKIDPDLLFFAGDQVYDHSRHLEYWLRFGRDFGELLRNIPSVCLPDDHDVGQANLWGDGGKRCVSRDGMAGGYYMPPEYVREVERAQTSHLPDPVDPRPVEQGIGVYFTHLRWGGMSFAIIEDRKFKSAPAQFNRLGLGRFDSIHDPNYDPKDIDSPEAKLLGERQLRFLENWVTDWRDAEMKCVLSQSPFVQMCNFSGQHEQELLADFDSNGFPKSGRDRALRVIRKASAVMVAGDQHLAGVVHHGVDDWEDAGYSFASPAIANYWLRWWDPKTPGENRSPGEPHYRGRFHDGFGNKMTVRAAANPTAAERVADEGQLTNRAAGYGVVRFDKRQRKITFECWPRNVDVSDPSARQYADWPITVEQADNHRLEGRPELPMLMLGSAGRVVTVYNDITQEVVSSLRVLGDRYQPRTPRLGSYSVAVGEGVDRVWLRGLQSQKNNSERIAVPVAATFSR